jgi:lipid II:glycine glycyltransferase (peptidoglycan interpeptide bridge formation enzyme)
MGIRVVRTLPEEEWRRFVGEHPHGNVFHTPDMFQVFSHARGHHPTLWATVDNDGQVLALLLPVQVTLLDGLFQYLTRRAVIYGSVLCAPGEEGQEALATLLHVYKRGMKGAPLFTELRNRTDLSSVQPILQENSYVYEDHLNFLIDLQRPVEDIWSSVHRNVRTNVRKARRMGVVIEEITSLDQIPVAYAILAKVYEHIQVPLAPPSLFEAAFEILYPRHMIKFCMARIEDVHIGVALRLLYKDVIYAWYAGAIRDYASHKANDLLNWHVLEWGAHNSFSCLDFGGAGKPDEDYGPRKFKAKFGGTLVNYGRNVCVHAPVRLQLSQMSYQLARRFWGERLSIGV